MAEHGAHLSSSAASNASRPNIFEILAQENLSTTIRPAVKHAVQVFAERYPAQWGPLLRYYDEIFLAFDLMVQGHYLTKFSSSFAENFYDLIRFPRKGSEETILSKSLQLRSLASLVLIPYIRQKLDTLFEDLRYAQGEISWKSLKLKEPNLSIRQRFGKLFLILYPYLHSSWEFTSLLCQLSYMLSGGSWHSIGMFLSGTELRRVSPDDEKVDSSIPTERWNASLSQFIKTVAYSAGLFLSTGLSVGVFFLQFLEWWYASNSRTPSFTSLPIPDPPQVLDQSENEICPLCNNRRSNSTALSVSGYVFCYICINQFVGNHHCCPVTSYPATYDHLVKLYEQES